MAVMALPEPYRKRLRTTNSLRRRERVIRIFPNEASIVSLIGALLMEQDDDWLTGRRYLDMNACREWRAMQEVDTGSRAVKT